MNDMILPEELFRMSPIQNITKLKEFFSLTQKSAFFVMTNGLRSLRTMTRNATLYQQ